MIVRCKAITAADIPRHYLDPRGGLDRSTQFPLTLDREYVVYAVAFQSDQVWLYIEDDDRHDYPLGYPAALFEVVDACVSKHWHLRQTPGNRDHSAILAIKEWVEDRFFYDRLTDREQQERELFQTAKHRMDAEAYGV